MAFASLQPVAGPWIPKVVNVKTPATGALATDRSKEANTKAAGHEGWVLAADVGKLKGAGTPLHGQTFASVDLYDPRGASDQTGLALWSDYVREGERSPQPTPQVYVRRDWVLELEVWNSVTDLVLQASIHIAVPPGVV